MGYRIHEKPRPRPRRTMQDTATPIRVYVHNGSTANLAIPCYYQEVHKPEHVHIHDPHWHDHVGWPSPSHPDHICQRWSPTRKICLAGEKHECSTRCRKYVNMASLIPIHLLSDYEGYKSARVSFISTNEETGKPEVIGNEEGVTTLGGIIAKAEISPEPEDWVVRVRFEVKDPDALEEPRKYRFAVFVDAPQRNGERSSLLSEARSDIVLHGELIVLPSAY